MSYSQPVRGLTTGKKIKIAEEQMDMGNVYNALEWYEKVYEEDNSNLEVINAIADIHNKLRDYVQAEKWVNRLVRKDKNSEYPLAKFWLGQILKKNSKYSEAIPVLQEFLAGAVEDKYKTLAQNEIIGAEMAGEMDTNPLLEEVANAGAVNSPSTEMSPVYAGSETFYFAALPADEVQLTEEAGYAKIFKSTKNPDGSWGEGVALEKNINSGHTVHPALNADASQMYFTRCELTGNYTSKCEIYRSSSLGENAWELASAVEGLNAANASSKQPALATINGQEAIVFVSDRAGGFGGWDIYYSVMNRNGTFDAPVNAGPEVNTVGDEETPFFHDDKLYFSSNGHPTIGGYDVFSADWKGAEYGDVRNMDKGVNSSVDDLYFSLSKDGYNGFVVSNRPGTISLKSETCCDDIFSLKFYLPLDIKAYTVNGSTREDIDGATVSITKIADATPPWGDSQTNPMSNEFAFENVERGFQYLLVGNKDGFFPDSTVVVTSGKEGERDISVSLMLKPIPPPPPPPPPVEATYVYIRMDTIYYDFDKSNIRPDAATRLDQIAQVLLSYPQLVVELSSHTDALGSNSYNDALAVRRSNSAIAYLEEKGVPSYQLVPLTYGEYRPAAANAYDDGRDNPVGRQLNRRTEFRILQGTDSQGRIRITTPSSSNPTGDVPPPPPPPEDLLKNGIAKMTFSENFYDFGEMKSGEKKTHVFSFENTGKVDLIIEFASGSCGCTVPEWPDKPIPPGGKGTITVEFDSKEKEGTQNQEVNIIANTDPIVTELKISAKVLPE